MSQRLYVNKDIEGSLWRQTAQTRNRIDSLHCTVAALLIFPDHILNLICLLPEGCYGRLLHKGRRTGRIVLMNFIENCNVLLRGCYVTDSPPRHGVCLGKSVHREGALLHPRQRGNAYMLLPVIDQSLVDLVGNHQKIFFHCKLCKSLQCLSV